MNGEHVILEGGTQSPILLDVTCTRCFRIYRYDCPLTAVINQVLADEGWRFPGIALICPRCIQQEQAERAQIDTGAIGEL